MTLLYDSHGFVCVLYWNKKPYKLWDVWTITSILILIIWFCRQIVNTLNVNMSGKRRKNEMIFYSLISAFQRIFQYLKRNIHNSKRKLWHSHPQPLLIKNDTQIVKAHAKWANNTHYKYTLIFHRGGLYYKILCTTKVRR